MEGYADEAVLQCCSQCHVLQLHACQQQSRQRASLHVFVPEDTQQEFAFKLYGALPGLVSSLLLWCDMMHAKDNVHTHVLLISSLCVPWAANRKGQLLGWHTQQLQSTRTLQSNIARAARPTNTLQT